MKKAKMKIIPFIIILAGVCLYFYQTQQVADTAMKYTGNVEGKEINLTTEVAGEITGVQVVEGENISKGDLLFSVDVSDYDIQLQQLKLQQEIATLNYDLLLDGASQEDVDLATSNMNSVSKQLSGAERSYEYAQDNYDDLKVLYASGAVSKTELNQSKLAADQAYAAMTSLQAQVDATKASLDKVLAGADDQALAIAKAEIELRALEIENLENTIQKGEKYAPIGGMVQSVNYDIGEYIAPGKTVISIINSDALSIDVYIREYTLYKVKVGDPVAITEGFLGDKTVTGKIAAISSEAEFTPKNVESKESKQEMVFKTTIEVTEGQEYLKPGMFVDVEILAKNE